jgi:hypothetical protein
MPALIADDEDDRKLAEAVERADVVVYNPKIFPTAPSALFEYAPRTATVLSTLFDRERDLTNSAIVLRKARATAPRLVVDLWESEPGEPLRPAIIWSDDDAAAQEPVFRDHWMVYRVVALRLPGAGVEKCFERRHCVEPGEQLLAMPMTHPEAWAFGGGKRVRFDIRASAGTQRRVLFSAVRNSDSGPDRLRLPLGELAGQCVDLSFCATALDEGVPRGLAGWGELQIVVGAAQPASGA